MHLIHASFLRGRRDNNVLAKFKRKEKTAYSTNLPDWQILRHIFNIKYEPSLYIIIWTFPVYYLYCVDRSRIHERTILLRFLGKILRILRLEVSLYNVYSTNQFQSTVAQGGGGWGIC
jgi:hypothetical protein